MQYSWVVMQLYFMARLCIKLGLMQLNRYLTSRLLVCYVAMLSSLQQPAMWLINDLCVFTYLCTIKKNSAQAVRVAGFSCNYNT